MRAPPSPRPADGACMCCHVERAAVICTTIGVRRGEWLCGQCAADQIRIYLSDLKGMSRVSLARRRTA